MNMLLSKKSRVKFVTVFRPPLPRLIGRELHTQNSDKLPALRLSFKHFSNSFLITIFLKNIKKFRIYIK